MTSYVLTVNEQMQVGRNLLNYLKSLSKTSDYVNFVPQKEYRLMEPVTLTKEEMELVEKSLKSGICTTDISELQNHLKSVYESLTFWIIWKIRKKNKR